MKKDNTFRKDCNFRKPTEVPYTHTHTHTHTHTRHLRIRPERSEGMGRILNPKR